MNRLVRSQLLVANDLHLQYQMSGTILRQPMRKLHNLDDLVGSKPRIRAALPHHLLRSDIQITLLPDVRFAATSAHHPLKGKYPGL